MDAKKKISHLLFIIRWCRSLCRPTPTAPEVTKMTSMPSEFSSLTCPPTESPENLYILGATFQQRDCIATDVAVWAPWRSEKNRVPKKLSDIFIFIILKSDPKCCISSRISSLPVHTEHRVSRGQASHLLLSLQLCPPTTIRRKKSFLETISQVYAQSSRTHKLLLLWQPTQKNHQNWDAILRAPSLG